LSGLSGEPSKIVAPIVIELRFVDWLAWGERARLGLKVRPSLADLCSLAGRARRGRRGWLALSGWKRAHPNKLESNDS
jgi:hypothetical protein